MKNIKPGEVFGELSFFNGKARKESAKTLDFVYMLKISLNEFIDILKEFPNDYEKYCEIKDRINFNNEFELIKIRCYSCGSHDHLIEMCPFIHKKFYKNLIFEKITFSKPHLNRNYSFQRREYKSLNSLCFIKDNESFTMKFGEDIPDDLYYEENIIGSLIKLKIFKKIFYQMFFYSCLKILFSI